MYVRSRLQTSPTLCTVVSRARHFSDICRQLSWFVRMSTKPTVNHKMACRAGSRAVYLTGTA